MRLLLPKITTNDVMLFNNEPWQKLYTIHAVRQGLRSSVLCVWDVFFTTNVPFSNHISSAIKQNKRGSKGLCQSQVLLLYITLLNTCMACKQCDTVIVYGVV